MASNNFALFDRACKKFSTIPQIHKLLILDAVGWKDFQSYALGKNYEHRQSFATKHAFNL